MQRIIHLTHWARAVKSGLCATVLALFLTTACKQSVVTQSAQADPKPTATLAAPTAETPVAEATPSASPTPPSLGDPAAKPAAGLPPVQTGIAPDYKQEMAKLAQATPTPAPTTGPTPDPAPNMRHLNNGKMLMVKGTQGATDFPTPPPTPTPTPAPTPTIEMVNGKIKQQWEAPAEFAAMKNPLKVDKDLLSRGKYLYKNRCEICHGAEGKGNGGYNGPQWKQSTNLASKVVQANTDGELFYKVSTSRDRHPASKVIYTDDERWMVVAFLRTLK